MTKTIDVPIDVMSSEEYSSNPDEMRLKLYEGEDVESFLRSFLAVRALAMQFEQHYDNTDKSHILMASLARRVERVCAWVRGYSCSTLFATRVLHYKTDPSKSTLVESVYNLYSLYMQRTLSSMIEGLKCNFSKPYYGYDKEHDRTPIVFIPPFKKEHFPESLRHLFDLNSPNFALIADETSAPSIDEQFYLERMFFKERT